MTETQQRWQVLADLWDAIDARDRADVEKHLDRLIFFGASDRAHRGVSDAGLSHLTLHRIMDVTGPRGIWWESMFDIVCAAEDKE